MFATKLTEKIPDPSNAKGYYKYFYLFIYLYYLFIYIKHKIGHRQKIITQQKKTFENPNVIDIKPVTIEYPKTSRKLSKIIT